MIISRIESTISSLDIAGAILAKNGDVPTDAQRLISKTPIPLVPFSFWRWMFTKIGGKWWIKQSTENGIRKEDMYAKPYSDEIPL